MSGRTTPGYRAHLRDGPLQPHRPRSLDGWAANAEATQLHYLRAGVVVCTLRPLRTSWRLVGSIKDRALCPQCVARVGWTDHS